MSIQLNHTIVHASDPRASARFLAELLGLGGPGPFRPFPGGKLDNGVTLDYIQAEGKPETEHYAFLVSDEEFDQIFERIQARGLTYWADPGRRQPGEINHHFGGRGVYWADPDGHYLEIVTKPYSKWSEI